MPGLEIVERGYSAARHGDREALAGVFTDDAVWNLMDRDAVTRSYEGREAVVEFLLGFESLRLEAIMDQGHFVVAAHSFATRRGRRLIAATVYEIRDGLVAGATCSDVMRRR